MHILSRPCPIIEGETERYSLIRHRLQWRSSRSDARFILPHHPKSARQVIMPQLSQTTALFEKALLRLDAKGAGQLLAGLKSQDQSLLWLEKVVVPALEHIGQDWEQGRVSLSQVYMAGKICEQLVDQLLPQGHVPLGPSVRLAIGVLEDYHALGKRMVKSALISSGYRVLDYGHGCKAADLVAKAQKDQIDLLLISCLMVASAVRVTDVVDGLEQAGCPTQVLVGGAPFRLEPGLWKRVGALAMGKNSAEAVRLVRTWKEAQ